MWTWYLSRQRTLPSRANSISNSTSPCFTGSRQIEQSSPALGPPHMPSGRRLGNFPAWITARAFSRRVRSSSTRSSMDRTSNRSVRIGGRRPRARRAAPGGQHVHLPSPYTKRRVPGGDDERTSASHAQCGRRGRRRVRAGDRRHGPVRRRAGAAPAGRAELRPHRSQAECAGLLRHRSLRPRRPESRHPSYFKKGLPHVDQVILRVIPDEANIVAALRTGQIHHACIEDNKNYNLLKDEKTLTGYRSSRLGYDYLNITATRGPLKDVRVRQAISWAVDRSQVMRVATAGFGRLTAPA